MVSDERIVVVRSFRTLGSEAAKFLGPQAVEFQQISMRVLLNEDDDGLSWYSDSWEYTVLLGRSEQQILNDCTQLMPMIHDPETGITIWY